MPSAGTIIDVPPNIDARVQITVDTLLDQRKFPGLSVAIVLNDKVVLSRGYGLADVANHTPVLSSTPFEIGSVSKTFAAFALMNLYEQRLGTSDAINLDVPFFTYMDAIPTPTGMYDLPSTWNQITTRQLLAMTSGIPDVGTDQIWQDQVKAVAAKPLAFPSGEQSLYSNANFYLIGALVGKLSGQPYGEYLATQILQPLNMLSTEVLGNALGVPGQAVGYYQFDPQTHRFPLASVSNGNAIFASGGVVTTADDMAKYMLVLLNNQFLQPATYRLMWASTPSIQYKNPAPPVPTFGFRGLGWDKALWNTAGPLQVNKNGEVPGYSAQLDLFPEQKDGVFIAFNVGQIHGIGNFQESGQAANDAIYAATQTAAIQGRVAHQVAGQQTPLEGFTVYLDANHNGQLDPGELSARTNGDGVYLFNDVPPGVHTVALVLPAGWHTVIPGGAERTFRLVAQSVATSPFELTRATRIADATRVRASGINLAFDNPLEGPSAASRRNYTLSLAGKDGVFGTKDDIRVRVARARYDAATSTVTLTAGRKLPSRRAVQVAVSSSIRTVYGLYLNGSGQKPGSALLVNLPARANVTDTTAESRG